ncbi:MAG: GIY-YIG nuclease family protein [Gammaproteobacteria bacterium]
MDSWYVYMLRCADSTLYTGITTDLERRLAEHNENNLLGARYTRARRPVSLVYHELCENRSAASKRESKIKNMSKPAKELLIVEQ